MDGSEERQECSTRRGSCKRSLRICRTRSSACIDFRRNNFRCVFFIVFGIVFVAYKRPPMGPEGAQGARRAPWPKGPEGPFGPLGPLALGLLHGALGPPLGPPRFARKNRNCAARKLRCELAALRRNCAACKWVGGRAERRRSLKSQPKIAPKSQQVDN